MLCKKIAALEHTEAGLIFGSGMAAIKYCIICFFKEGRPYRYSATFYGGTYNLLLSKSLKSMALNILLQIQIK